MINIINKIATSKEFLAMSPAARLLFYDLCTYTNQDRSFDYSFKDGIIEMTHSNAAAFEQLYQNGFVVIDRRGLFNINKYWGMGKIIDDLSRQPNIPSVEKVVEYCDGKISKDKLKEFCERFVDYYNANGWKLSNGRPIRDWKAVCNMWIKKEIKLDRPKDNGLIHHSDEEWKEFFEIVSKEAEKPWEEK